MASKPIRRGFKFHCLVDHGFTFLLTSNQTVPSIGGITPTGDMLYHLLRQLSQSIYWIAYLDGFYATISLLGRSCYGYRIGGCSTARLSSVVPRPRDPNLIYSDIGGLPLINHKELRLQCALDLILVRPSARTKTRSQDTMPKLAEKVYIKPAPHSCSIAVNLATCLSIYHRVRSLLVVSLETPW